MEIGKFKTTILLRVAKSFLPVPPVNPAVQVRALFFWHYNPFLGTMEGIPAGPFHIFIRVEKVAAFQEIH
jgi:hypothetical protein